MLVRILMVSLLLLSNIAVAAPLTWSDKPYSHFSDQEPLSDLLATLASTQNVAVVVSPNIKDVVSLHYKMQEPKAIFEDLAKTYGLIWFYDGETLYIYKESEAQRGSVSLEKMSPQAFTTAMKRLNVLDSQYHWEVSEVDNMIYFTGPERFVTAVLDMAKIMDTQKLERPQVYKWVDSKGQVNYSNERPEATNTEVNKDVATKDRFPGFDVVDVINR
jgi:type II secretory pathway component GspD/PulD (secretin)